MSLFEELKRRKVFKAGAAYLVVAWLLVQVASIAFPAFDAPPWALRVFMLLCLLGFPVALVLSWMLTLTSEGIKLDPAVSGTKRVIGASALLAVLALSWFYRGQPALREASVPPTAVPTAAVPAAKPVDARSIAVLPFENQSEDKSNAYFADGIQDEILTGLAKVGGLKVISRTSTAKYASRPDNLSKIAAELGVAYILEGGVQKSGNTVRVNVQLIDAASDSHVWAETYTRELANVFVVQSEVAEAIARALKATITSDARAALAERPTQVPEAYAAYLRGLAVRSSASVFNRAEMEQLEAAIEEAVRLDPAFGRAWAMATQTRIWRYVIGWDASPAQKARALDALKQAERLAPGDSETDIARTFYLYYGEQQFAKALEFARSATAKAPGDSRALFLQALLERRIGDFKSAIEHMRAGIALDPADLGPNIELAFTLFVDHRFEEVLKQVPLALALEPDEVGLHGISHGSHWELGGNGAARRYLDALKGEGPAFDTLRAQQARLEGHPELAVPLWRKSLASKDDTTISGSFGQYVPSRVEWQLQLATDLRHGDPAAARVEYAAVEAQARAGLAGQNNRYTEGAWRLARAWALAGLGRKDEAIAEAERGAAAAPMELDAIDGTTFQEYRLLVYLETGERAKAEALVAKLRNRPGSLLTDRRLREDPLWRLENYFPAK